jgi:hypothetical protein
LRLDGGHGERSRERREMASCVQVLTGASVKVTAFGQPGRLPCGIRDSCTVAAWQPCIQGRAFGNPSLLGGLPSGTSLLTSEPHGRLPPASEPLASVPPAPSEPPAHSESTSSFSASAQSESPSSFSASGPFRVSVLPQCLWLHQSLRPSPSLRAPSVPLAPSVPPAST